MRKQIYIDVSDFYLNEEGEQMVEITYKKSLDSKERITWVVNLRNNGKLKPKKETEPY